MSRFTYDILEADSNKVGSLTWPDLALATNARLRGVVPNNLTTQLKIEFQGRQFPVDFEYLTRDWFNDIRFVLKDGDQVLASAEVRQKKRARPTIQITNPFNGDLIRTGGLFSTRYEVTHGKHGVGEIFEKPGFSLKRELIIDLPASIPGPVQCFFLFLVMNHAYR